MRAGSKRVSLLVAGLLSAKGALGEPAPAASSPTQVDGGGEEAAPVRSAPVHARHTYTLKECLGFAERNYPKNQVRLSVRQAYYGALLSRDAQALLNEALSRVEQYLPKVEEKVRAGDGDDIQLIKLRIPHAELEARRSEAQKQERIALASLRF